MKPIETTYKGYRMRSRSEGRFAVFLDRMGVSWEYEPAGFDLGEGVRYLPDFLVAGRLYVEIKPPVDTIEEATWAIATRKAAALTKASGVPVLIICGTLGTELKERQGYFYSDTTTGNAVLGECPHCGAFGYSVYPLTSDDPPRLSSVPCSFSLFCADDCGQTDWPREDSNRRSFSSADSTYGEAVEAARSFRFEPGAHNPEPESERPRFFKRRAWRRPS